MRRALPLAVLALALAACDSTPSAVEADSLVIVDYVGTLEDGSVFGQSRGAAFDLQDVVPGFRDGLIGMAVGETRTFSVPPEEAYGAEGLPPVIPPNATLTFEVTVLAIR